MSEEIPAHQRMTLAQLLEAAYVEGWRKSIEMYAVWKDGQILTAMGRSARDEMKQAPTHALPHFQAWLERQKETFGGG